MTDSPPIEPVDEDGDDEVVAEPPPKTVDELAAELRAWNDAQPPPGPIHLYDWPPDEPAEGEGPHTTLCCRKTPRSLEDDAAGGHSFTADPSLVTCSGS